MTLTDTASGTHTVTPEQVFEIQAMAEGGQFADALIRLRKIKASFPNNTFFVALEKQLERLLVLPRDSEPSEAQKKELLDSLPGLIQGAVQTMQHAASVRPVPPPSRASTERVDRESARAQLKEQYFQHADEYLKKGAYGSALVEIRRVKIIAPDDQTALEYERTIRQLVELQQRKSVKRQEADETPAPPEQPPAVEHEAPSATVREFGDNEPLPEERITEPAATATPAPRRRGKGLLFGLLIAIAATVAALGLLTAAGAGDEAEPAVTPAGTSMAPADVQPKAVPAVYRLPESPNTAAERKQEIIADTERPTVQEPTSRSNSGGAIENTVPGPVANVGSEERRGGEPVQREAERTESPVPGAEVVRDPEIVKLEQPVFSPEALAIPGGGEVVIMVQIDPEGKPVKTLIAKSTNPLFNQAIVAAVLTSTYRPGRTAEGPATKWLTIPFRVR